MTLRRRTFLLFVAGNLGMILLALLIVDRLVDRALRRQLDGALATHARTEAASCFDRPGGKAHVHERPIESTSGALTKYAAIYDIRSGEILVKTTTFLDPPPLDPTARTICARGEEYLVDLKIRTAEGLERQLRGVWVPAPEPVAPQAILLLAVPDEMEAHVQRQIRLAAVVAVLVGLLIAAGVARLLAQRLLRGTEGIARAARRVAAGDLSARVIPEIPDEEIAALGLDLNDMIERLGRLMAAQRRFTSDAAHELRSPITAVLSQLEVTLRRERTPEDYRECLVSCVEDAQRLSALADDLLALARLEGRPTRGSDPVELRHVVQQTLLRLSEQASAAGVQLDLLPGAPVWLAGDSLQLSRLLRNLVENALRVSAAGAAVEVSVRKEGPRVTLEVMDRGPGVQADMQARIFEPFVRLDEGRARTHGGTGLGLAIAREIARVHGGELGYRDRPGGGAIFTVVMLEESAAERSGAHAL